MGGGTNISGGYKYINIFVPPGGTNILIYLYGGVQNYGGVRIFHDTGKKPQKTPKCQNLGQNPQQNCENLVQTPIP